MSFVDSFAGRLAEKIHDNVENSSSVDVLRFSLVVTLNYLLVAAFILIVCTFTDHLYGAVICLIMAPLFRQFSGGIHFKSSMMCNMVSAFLMLLSIHLPISFSYTGVVLTIISIVLMLLYAPQGIKGFSRLEPKYYPILKFGAVFILCTNFYFQSPLLAMVLFTQSILATNMTQKVIDYLKL